MLGGNSISTWGVLHLASYPSKQHNGFVHMYMYVVIYRTYMYYMYNGQQGCLSWLTLFAASIGMVAHRAE